MNIKYKYIEHERMEDAPFVGALVVAPSCNLKCKHCFNRPLKKLKNKIATGEEIIGEIKSNEFNQGLILGGLEWSESPKELLEIVKIASKNNLKIMIYTGLDLYDFYEKIGKQCVNDADFNILDLPNFMETDLPQLYRYIGACILDYYISDDYYIKAGKYDETKKTSNRVHFGVHLATENQNIYLIKKEKE